MAEITLANIAEAHPGTAMAAVAKYQYAQSHEARFDALREVLDHACNQLVLNRHLKQGLSEDQLTVEIVSSLALLGFQAAHDQQIGGHCDIVVQGNNAFLWIAEAKLHGAYAWLDSGFKQLAERYSTGVDGQDQGEVLIYAFAANSNSLLERWKKELLERNPDVVAEDDENPKSLVFWSTHNHSASGLPFKVRHKIVTLYFKPVK